MNQTAKATALFTIMAIAGAATPLRAEEGAPPAKTATESTKPVIEVCFVLDSTGSMGGLIEGAKQKIWSIANTIISRKPTPLVKIALITYRDRGDEYVTKRFDLTDDIDTVFNNLQTFKANGGGDGPESVNQALDEAVNKISWSKDKAVYKVIFLVGDYPPHMDYQDDVKYAQTCQTAVKSDLVINTVQCGNQSDTAKVWQEIARLSEGSYVALAQSGNMAIIETPFDKEIAKLNADLGKTVIAYGSREQRSSVAMKMVAVSAAPSAVAADRAAYNLKTEGKAVQGAGDLLNDVKEKSVVMESLKEEELPAEMQKMTAAERSDYVGKKQKERDAINGQLADLSRKRSEYIDAENKRLAAAGKGDSFDAKVAETINIQADKKR